MNFSLNLIGRNILFGNYHEKDEDDHHVDYHGKHDDETLRDQFKCYQA